MGNAKKLMLLGGLRYLIPVIQSAHEEGYYVITADYLPDNIAHKYSDEYVNVSIIDKEAVLRVAREKAIDGIISFAVDPGVMTAAYVQEQMGLPSMGPYKSVEILQNKDLFRAFLSEHGFNVPKAKGYSCMADALSDTSWLTFPMIVKPTDSAGSKGVTRIDNLADYRSALEEAFSKSISGHVIVEQFIEKHGCSSDTDSFLLDGELKYVTFNAQRFDPNAANPYTPSAYTWPSTFTAAQEDELTSELQRLMKLLNMRTSVFNIETRIGTDGKPYIMEVSPRGGGNRLCEMVRFATGVDMIKAQVRAVVGDPIGEIESLSTAKPTYHGHWAEVILHAEQDGIYQNIVIADSMKQYVKDMDMWVKEGDKVSAFNGANDTIGTLKACFDSEERMHEFINNTDKYIKILQQ